MTIHGKSRYPGLNLWTREWEKVTLKFPAGCLFVQAGATFEHLTSGYVMAGLHEVTYNEKNERGRGKETGILGSGWPGRHPMA